MGSITWYFSMITEAPISMERMVRYLTKATIVCTREMLATSLKESKPEIVKKIATQKV